MAISLVSDGGVAGSSSATPFTVSRTSTVGNTVIITGLVYNGTSSLAGITSVTDNTAGSNTWHYATTNSNRPPSQVITSGGDYACMFVAWSILAADITSVIIAAGTGSPFWRLSTAEFSGIVAAGSGGASTGTSAAPATTVTLNNSGCLVTGVSNVLSASYTAPPAGWTNFSGAGSVDNIGYDLPGTTGNYTVTWTLGSSDTWGNAVQVFSPVPIVAGGGLLAATFP